MHTFRLTHISGSLHISSDPSCGFSRPFPTQASSPPPLDLFTPFHFSRCSNDNRPSPFMLFHRICGYHLGCMKTAPHPLELQPLPGTSATARSIVSLLCMSVHALYQDCRRQYKCTLCCGETISRGMLCPSDWMISS